MRPRDAAAWMRSARRSTSGVGAFLEQRRLRHEDRQRVVEFVRHPGEERAHRRQLFDLVDALLLALDLRSGLALEGQVMRICREDVAAVDDDVVDRDFGEEGALVSPHRGELERPAEHAANARLAKAPKASVMRVTAFGRHDQIGNALAHRVCRRVAEELFGAAVEADDATIAIRDDYRIEHGIDHRPLEGLGAP